MRIIHCADLHLDSKLESNLSRDNARKRKEELVKSFLKLVEIEAPKYKVEIILIAGDLFDTAKSAERTIKKRILFIIQQNPQITFLYLRGNHDKENFFSTEDNCPENLKFFTSDKWTSYDFGPLCISGREVFETVSESLYTSLVLDASKINIVTLHGEVVKSTGKNDAPLFNLSKLKGKNIDYLALGHIHSYSREKLDSRGVYCYSGCLEGRGFDETGPKGYVLLDVDEESHKISSRFIETSIRKLYAPEINISSYESYSEILSKISSDLDQISSDSMVKVILKGDVSETADIEIDSFTRQLESKFFFLKIYDKTEIKIDYEKYRNDISLKGEFVRTVESKDLPEDEKSKIIIAGLKALSGKDF
ncbi:MAG: DNA repair exonuclease [Treponema sp.]|nr:DNA repair exonuclease [Treponema sp.]